jgi:membrane protein implicated in regulation of membrane protease activity
MKYTVYTKKMQWLMLAFIALLFAALTPGVLVTLPPRSSKLVVALTHGVVFALVYHLTRNTARAMLGGREGVDKTLKKEKDEDKKHEKP